MTAVPIGRPFDAAWIVDDSTPYPASRSDPVPSLTARDPKVNIDVEVKDK